MFWYIASGIMVLLYGFSIGWRTETNLRIADRMYTLLLADGRLAGHSSGVTPWSDAHQFTIEPVSWSFELKVLPRIERIGWLGYIVVLPLWLLALPIWCITFINWRRSRPKRAAHECSKCGYDLSGAPADAQLCPECGAAFQSHESC